MDTVRMVDDVVVHMVMVHAQGIGVWFGCCRLHVYDNNISGMNRK
ncbi:hypothetical protein HanIR_Chr01g0002671 [Helianthus annuus]|nr:hypothetical protein HanIR_Chr01g0002671 [Helianthus annuus]